MILSIHILVTVVMALTCAPNCLSDSATEIGMRTKIGMVRYSEGIHIFNLTDSIQSDRSSRQNLIDATFCKHQALAWNNKTLSRIERNYRLSVWRRCFFKHIGYRKWIIDRDQSSPRFEFIGWCFPTVLKFNINGKASGSAIGISRRFCARKINRYICSQFCTGCLDGNNRSSNANNYRQNTENDASTATDGFPEDYRILVPHQFRLTLCRLSHAPFLAQVGIGVVAWVCFAAGILLGAFSLILGWRKYWVFFGILLAGSGAWLIWNIGATYLFCG